MKNKFPYEWTLKDANFTKDKGTVFSCFACGGGSTMGYKLAGFDVLGCNEIDPKMIEAYKTNHNPKYAFLEPIQTFKLRNDLPKELYNLDILDGSPPCSSFSMAGNREKDWGKDKKFREGQTEQVLDTLFFDFIDLAKKLQPKVVVAENVKGMLLGEAKKYVREVYDEFLKAGYQLKIQPYLLNASKMGVPQRRERVFFIAIRNDLSEQFMEQVDMFQIAPKLDLEFNEKTIPYKLIENGEYGKEVTLRKIKDNFHSINAGEGCRDYFRRTIGKETYFSYNKAHPEMVIPTITASDSGTFHYKKCNYLADSELKLIGSYPTDYDFVKLKPKYLIGMSVPPLMTAQIAIKIHEQWLNKLTK